MNTPLQAIQVRLGVTDEKEGMPISYWLYDTGVKFEGKYTQKDMELSIAILRDLADALEHKINTVLH